jgi:acetyl-CoA carboxylase biotin carboxyl carrier protein
MKMEIPLVAEDGGTLIEICVNEGDSVSEGQVLAIIER